MLKNDFKETKSLLKILNTKKGKTSSFCESCFSVNPDTDDGYTTCCNERRVDGDEALANAKQQDVQRFLDSKFATSSSGRSNNAEFILKNKNKKWTMNLERMDMDDIIKTVKTNIKGLRSEYSTTKKSGPKM